VRLPPIAVLAVFLASGIFIPPRPAAQEAPDAAAPWDGNAGDWDFDTLFDEPPADEEVEEGGEPPADPSRRPGFSLDFSYSANGGIAPGWSEAPWYAGQYKAAYTHVFGANLNAYVGLDVRVSESLRTHTSLSFAAPGSALYLGEFFFDYQVGGRVFFRVGKFGQGWGLSPNFPAADLPSRVPEGKGGDSYVLKADVPVGVGGLQLLTLARSGFLKSATPGFRELAYGGKYNLAFTWADVDLGFFYHEEMPLRGSASVKTTVGNTELYFEAMGAVRHKTWDKATVSGNLGFARSFFGDLLSVNGEAFWNGEENAYYFVPKTEFEEAEVSPFIPGLNAALNVVFRPGWAGNLRFAVAARWALETNTAYIVPALSFSPLPHLGVSLGFPLALGGRNGRYYSAATSSPFAGNADINGRPVGVALLVNLGAGYRLDRY
jgi:hypothetical protein